MNSPVTDLVEVPPRHGFALRDALDASQSHNATYLGKVLERIREKRGRIIGSWSEAVVDRTRPIEPSVDE